MGVDPTLKQSKMCKGRRLVNANSETWLEFGPAGTAVHMRRKRNINMQRCDDKGRGRGRKGLAKDRRWEKHEAAGRAAGLLIYSRDKTKRNKTST